MKVAIDARVLSGKITGPGRYLKNLVLHLAETAPESEFVLYSDKSIAMPSPYPNLRPQLLAGHHLLWKHLLIPIEQVRQGLDLFFVSSYSAPFFNPKRSVVTIHDLTYLRFPELAFGIDRWRFKTTVRLSAPFADKIIAVSEATRNDILKFVRVPAKKVEVIYEGVGSEFRKIPRERADKTAAKLNLKQPFILYVGSIAPHKNIERLISAFAQLLGKKKVDHHLVLCGLNYCQDGVFENWVERERLRGLVHHLGYVTDEELVALYNLADVFIYPSIYEGFGLPVLEAMACGAPVVTSNASSLPEIAGDAALLVEPTDTAAFADALEKILIETALRKELIEKGVQQSRKFTWRRAAQETFELFSQAIA